MKTYVNLPFTDYIIDTTNGEVRTHLGEVCKQKITRDGTVVELIWIDGHRFYDLGVIMFIASRVLPYPNYVILHMRSYRADDDYSNYSLDNIYIYFDEPVPVIGMQGFYHIPYFPQYVIKHDGTIYSYRRHKCLSWLVTKPIPNDVKNRTMGYRHTVVYNDMSEQKVLTRHRALCLAFKAYNQSPWRLVINHLNGKPGDDRLENLEWCTRQENNIHALENGYCPNSVRPITYVNYITGEKTNFGSIAMAAKKLGISHAMIQYRLQCTDRLYPDGMVFYDTSTPVELPTKLVRTGVHMPVACQSEYREGSVVYPSIGAASRATRVSTTAISQRCRGLAKNPIKGWSFSFQIDTQKYPLLTEALNQKKEIM